MSSCTCAWVSATGAKSVPWQWGQAAGGGHRHNLVNAPGPGALPGRMAHRRTPLFRGRGRRVGLIRRPRVPAFELAAMERLVGGLELLHLGFQFPVAAVGLGQLRVELL